MPNPNAIYLGVDVGGTNIQASIVEPSGLVLARRKTATPRGTDPEPVLTAIEQIIDELLRKADRAEAGEIAAIGIAVPGVVDPEAGRVIVTPNMGLSGAEVSGRLERKFNVPVVLGNDCNLGTLGEKWLGAARHAQSVMGILLGTGIGGGLVQGSTLWRGARESAAEIGHTIIQIGGPKCSCGHRGCLESIAGRHAIERDLREAVAAGRPTVLTEILEGDLGIVRSSVLRRALERDDPLVQEVLRRAAEALGHACLTVRHLVDPEVIVLGGGVIEACGDFIVPIVEEIVAADPLHGAREGGHVLISALGDDAVVLGAVAQARIHVGQNPFKKQHVVNPTYAELALTNSGKIRVSGKSFRGDFHVTVNGKAKNLKLGMTVNGEAKKQEFPPAESSDGKSHVLDPQSLAKACEGGPELLIIGTGRSCEVELTEPARRYLLQRSIEWHSSPNPEAVQAYNESSQRRAALFHVACPEE